jgi:hypothetical protein
MWPWIEQVETASPQSAGDCARQQARPHRLGCAPPRGRVYQPRIATNARVIKLGWPGLFPVGINHSKEDSTSTVDHALEVRRSGDKDQLVPTAARTVLLSFEISAAKKPFVAVHELSKVRTV